MSGVTVMSSAPGFLCRFNHQNGALTVQRPFRRMRPVPGGWIFWTPPAIFWKQSVLKCSHNRQRTACVSVFIIISLRFMIRADVFIKREIYIILFRVFIFSCFRDELIFLGSPINRDLRLAPTGLSGLGYCPDFVKGRAATARLLFMDAAKFKKSANDHEINIYNFYK